MYFAKAIHGESGSWKFERVILVEKDHATVAQSRPDVVERDPVAVPQVTINECICNLALGVCGETEAGSKITGKNLDVGCGSGVIHEPLDELLTGSRKVPGTRR